MIKWAAAMAMLIALIVGSIQLYNQYTPIGRDHILKRAIPTDAAFFIEIQNLKNFSKEIAGKSYSNDLMQLPLLKKLNDYFSVLNPLCEKFSDWNSVLYRRNIIASFHSTGLNKFDIALLLDFSNEGEPDIADQVAGLNLSSVVRNFRGEKIYEINFKQNGNSKLNIAILNNVCIISSTATLTEDAISQMMGRQSLMQDKSFSDLVNHTANEFDMSVYFNYGKMADFCLSFLQKDTEGYCKSASAFAQWSFFDLKFLNTEIKVHGFTSAYEKSNWLQYFDLNASLKNGANSSIPDIASIVMSNSLGSNSAFDKVNNSLQTNSDYRRYIKTWLGNEMDFVLTEPVNNNLLPQSFLVFNGVNPLQAKKSLSQWAIIKSGGDSSVFSKYKANSIFHLKVGDDFYTCFPNSIVKVSNPYCCVINNSVIMSNSLGQMKMYLDKIIDKNVLPEELFNPAIFNNAQYSFWINPSRLKDLILAVASEDFKQNLKEYYQMIRKCNSVFLPFTFNEKFYETNGTILFSDNKSIADRYAWKLTLDTAAIIAPQVKQDAENNKIIFIQDAYFQLYLINKGGDVVWKRKLDSPVMGIVNQLDLYSNGEQQYVFNTASKIYMIDINGKDINNFPIRLAANATSPLSMIDFDGKKQFKYFVSCSNGCIYGFEKAGKPLGGWNPNPGNGFIKMPLQFFQFGKNEMLSVVNSEGNLLLFDRNGKKSGKEFKVDLNISTPILIDKKNQLVAIDSTGIIYALGLNGKSNRFKLIADEANCALMNLGIDSMTEVSLLFPQKLIRFGIDTSQIFTYSFESGNPSRMTQFQLPESNEFVLLVEDENNEVLYLINSAGKLMNGFPKKGNSYSQIAALFDNSEPVLLTIQNGNELIVYRLDNLVQ